MNKYFKYSLIILICVNIFTYWIIFEYFYLGRGIVNFLDVGQGDAELVQTYLGNILIDAGPDASLVRELNNSLPFFDRTIDLFILSHPNKDHFYGIFEILDKYKIRAVMLNNVFYSDVQYQKLLQEFEKRNILILKGFNGVKVDLGKNDILSVLYPKTMVSLNEDPNKFSLVLSLCLEKNQFLFTGDISDVEEKEIISFLSRDNKFRVLKVAHHGSRYASSELFLESFMPHISVIEVGHNSYNHPHPDTLQRLEKIGSEILRTDLDGTIRFKIE
ncbi:MAG: MBL fold metallo-hydrolase [Candidatus Pacebacteria bacterium]|jgi:competence protein ComEC|nr:MBL fold metallo-hydrolase [Candidatus Paceibacterota bacterium]MDD4994373.1 MBL fold metallo-hydrolase [Candidatus Paceibacterota bacterium]MDD5535078.1 MBL fold metallo-hydrolase [Candidatus Paceibacterota bacterium]